MKGIRVFLQRERRLAVVGFAAAFVLVSGATTALTLGGRRAFFRPAVRQPISFNHRKHVKELDLACTTCHLTVETEAFSGLPDADVCAGCHLEPQGKSEEEKRLVEMLKKGTALAWKPLFRQPAHIFYSHRRHVIAAKLQCRVCHGAIADTVAPPVRVRRLVMDDCVSCHRKAHVSTDCTACHR
jgi:Cytochrome c7 and related cytochrome c/Class III cytochrome C family